MLNPSLHQDVIRLEPTNRGFAAWLTIFTIILVRMVNVLLYEISICPHSHLALFSSSG